MLQKKKKMDSVKTYTDNIPCIVTRARVQFEKLYDKIIIIVFVIHSMRLPRINCNILRAMYNTQYKPRNWN